MVAVTFADVYFGNTVLIYIMWIMTGSDWLKIIQSAAK